METNIYKLKKYAECASAGYAFFNVDDFIKSYNFNKVSLKMTYKIAKKTFSNYIISEFSQEMALDFRFRGFPAIIKDRHIAQLLNDDFSALNNFLPQTINFFKRYTIKAHQSNTATGFSATLFYDKEDKEYILAMRGIDGLFLELKEFYNNSHEIFELFMGQYIDMLMFYEQEVKPCIQTQRLIVVGNSLGGSLAQYFALSFHNNFANNLEVYTFNSLGIDDDIVKKLLNIASEKFFLPFNIKYTLPMKDTIVKTTLTSSSSDVLEYIKSSLYLPEYIHRLAVNTENISSIDTNTYVYHVESCMGLSSTNQWAKGKPIQHLLKDINGKYLFVNNNVMPASQHDVVSHKFLSYGIEHIVSTLYFYEYILENDSNRAYYDTQNITKLINQLNDFVFQCNFAYYFHNIYSKRF